MIVESKTNLALTSIAPGALFTLGGLALSRKLLLEE
jgi:hypothetical protein